MPSRPDPVWLLFRRRTTLRFAYWLHALGFNIQDRSLSNLMFFVYFCIFWLVWVVAVIAWLGSALANVFAFFPGISPSSSAVLLSIFVLVGWGFFMFWRVTGRSPFIFSEPDAFLLCQAPIRRRSVGMAWFLMDWVATGFLFAAGTLLLSFALTDIALSDTVSLLSLPIYVISSLRALAIILPIQMGIQAGLYGLGALRLRRDLPIRQLSWLRFISFPLGLCLLAAFIFPVWRTIIFTPPIFLLRSAFDGMVAASSYWISVGLSLVALALGVASLLIFADRMHLGRAAQESHLESIVRQVRGVMNHGLIAHLKDRRKLGIRYPSSRVPARNGAWMLIWKRLIQSWRLPRVNHILRWIMVFFLNMAIYLSSDWPVQLTVGVIWAVMLGNLTNSHLRSDLARWWLLRSLPFRSSILFPALLGPACGAGVMLGWLALILTDPSPPFGWLFAVLSPFMVMCAALGSAHDIIDHAKARVLMTPGLAEENVPHQNIQGVLLVVVSVGLPLGLLTWGSSDAGGAVWRLLSLPAAILMTVILFRSVLRRYRWIK